MATKMLSRLIPVDKPRPEAKKRMNAIVMPKRAFWLLVKFKARIGPMTKRTAINTLRIEMSLVR